jgi:hypothetical protein
MDTVGNPTVEGYIRDRWRHEAMTDQIQLRPEMSDGRDIHVWAGVITFVQPRIRLTRCFDQQSHAYQGYLLGVRGTLDGVSRLFVIAIGKAAHARHQFRIGDEVSGVGVEVADPLLETADLYRIHQTETDLPR